jgi:hypothetical protein
MSRVYTGRVITRMKYKKTSRNFLLVSQFPAKPVGENFSLTNVEPTIAARPLALPFQAFSVRLGILQQPRKVAIFHLRISKSVHDL